MALGIGCSERKMNNSYDVWLWVLGVLKERGTTATTCGSECPERKRNNSYDVWLWVLGVLKERLTTATMCGSE